MLQSLQWEKFRLFNHEEFSLCPGLNGIVGENSMGKSHLLKAAYAVTGVP